MSNLKRLQAIAEDHFITSAIHAWGPTEAAVAVRGFLVHLKSVHYVLDYESISGSLTVFYTLPVQMESLLTAAPDYVLDQPNRLALHNEGSLTVRVMPDGSLHVWKESVERELIQKGAIVYRFAPQDGERMWVNGVESGLPPSMRYARAFGMARFGDVAQSLEHYAITLARPSECEILRSSWREQNRVMWVGGPENIMQRSLYQFLKGALREGNPDITVEEPVDGVYPVDIKIRWEDVSRMALIEVKWLGKSGHLDPPRVTADYSKDDKALDGLQQLAAYLDSSRSRAGTYDRRGFLFVFDGRRANVTARTADLAREDGMAFRDTRIDFQPELLARNDIADPIRCFCEPQFNAGVSPSRLRKKLQSDARAAATSVDP